MKARRLVPLYPNAAGLTFVPPPPDGRWPIDGTPTIDLEAFGSEPPALGGVTLVIPTRDLIGLVAYVQKLGTDRGAWRGGVRARPERPGRRRVRAARPGGAGRAVYRARVSVSRPQGRRQRPAATFLSPRPRDFTLAVFKFRTTPSGSLPADGDLSAR